MDERAHCTVYLGASSISHPKHKWYLIYSIYLPFGDIARAIHRFILLIETEMFRENRVTKWWMVSRLIYYLILSVSLVRHDVFRSNWLCFSLLAYAYSMKDNNDLSAKQESTTNAADTHSYVFVYECIGNDGCIFFLYLFVSGRQFNWDARVSKTEWPLDVDGALPWIDRMKSSRHANSELWCDHRWWGTHTPSRRTHTVVLVVHSSIIRKPATKGDERQAPGTCRSSSHKCAWHWKIISCDKLNTLSYFIIILPYAWCIHHQI